MRQLNALAHHVAQKLKSLGATKDIVDRASAQAGQVNELVWDMDRKITKLNDESQWIKEIEGNVARFQELQQRFATDLAAAEQQKSEFGDEGAKLKEEITKALSQIQQRLESAALLKEEVEVANRRAMEVYASIGKLEEHMKMLATKDEATRQGIQRADELQRKLTHQQTELQGIEAKVEGLRSFEARLDGMQGAANQVSAHAEAIAASQDMIAETRRQIVEFGEARAEIESGLENLKRSREDVQRADELLKEFRRTSVEAESTIREITPRFEVLDQVQNRLAAMDHTTEKLDERMKGLGPRLEFVEGVEARLDRLTELSREVDDRIDGQLSRKAELDAMRTSHEGLSSQVRDLSNLINSLKEDKSLGEMEGRSVALKSQLEALQEKLVSFELLEKVIQDREARAEELAAKLDALTAAIEQNGSRASVLDQEMEKLDSGRREWLQEVHRIGEDQKAIRESAAVTGQQIEQIKTLTAQLEDKQAKLNASETKIERYEERLQALEDLMQGVDTKIDDVEKRQEAVDHVRLQVGNLFESTEKTRNDAMEAPRGTTGDRGHEAEARALAAGGLGPGEQVRRSREATRDHRHGSDQDGSRDDGARGHRGQFGESQGAADCRGPCRREGGASRLCPAAGGSGDTGATRGAGPGESHLQRHSKREGVGLLEGGPGQAFRSGPRILDQCLR